MIDETKLSTKQLRVHVSQCEQCLNSMLTGLCDPTMRTKLSQLRQYVHNKLGEDAMLSLCVEYVSMTIWHEIFKQELDKRLDN